MAAWALIGLGYTLGQLGHNQEAIEVYDKVVERFGKATETALLEQVAKALVNKGVRLGQLAEVENNAENCRKAKETLTSALEIYRRLNLTEGIQMVRHCLD